MAMATAMRTRTLALLAAAGHVLAAAAAAPPQAQAPGASGFAHEYAVDHKAAASGPKTDDAAGAAGPRHEHHRATASETAGPLGGPGLGRIVVTTPHTSLDTTALVRDYVFDAGLAASPALFAFS